MKKKLFTLVFMMMLFTLIAGNSDAEAAGSKVGRAAIGFTYYTDEGLPRLYYKYLKGVSGYELYRKTSTDKDWVKIKTFKQNTKENAYSTIEAVNFVDSKLKAKAGSNVKYKMRAYIKKGGKITYGKFSKILTVKKVLLPSIKLHHWSHPMVVIRSNIILNQKKNSFTIATYDNKIHRLYNTFVTDAIYFTEDAVVETDYYTFSSVEFCDSVIDAATGKEIEVEGYKDINGEFVDAGKYDFIETSSDDLDVYENLAFGKAKGGCSIVYTQNENEYWDLIEKPDDLPEGESRVFFLEDRIVVLTNRLRGMSGCYVTTIVRPNDYNKDDTSTDWKAMLKETWDKYGKDIIPTILLDGAL